VAEKLHAQAAAIHTRLRQGDNVLKAWLAVGHGRVCQHKKKHAEAEKHYQTALTIYQNIVGENHRYVADARRHLGRLHLEQGRHGDAETLLKQALGFFEEHFGADHPEIARSLEAHAALLNATGKAAEAEQSTARAQAIRAKFRTQKPSK
jgi:tetratricopeptide (TPR) repeat protein